jgi:hypothetical protein
VSSSGAWGLWTRRNPAGALTARWPPAAAASHVASFIAISSCARSQRSTARLPHRAARRQTPWCCAPSGAGSPLRFIPGDVELRAARGSGSQLGHATPRARAGSRRAQARRATVATSAASPVRSRRPVLETPAGRGGKRAHSASRSARQASARQSASSSRTTSVTRRRLPRASSRPKNETTNGRHLQAPRGAVMAATGGGGAGPKTCWRLPWRRSAWWCSRERFSRPERMYASSGPMSSCALRAILASVESGICMHMRAHRTARACDAARPPAPVRGPGLIARRILGVKSAGPRGPRVGPGALGTGDLRGSALRRQRGPIRSHYAAAAT